MISETRLNNGWEINIPRPIAPAKNAKFIAGWYVLNVFVIGVEKEGERHALNLVAVPAGQEGFRVRIDKSVIKADLVGRAKRPTLSVSVR